MGLLLKLCVIGSVILLYSRASGNSLSRQRRQDFVFPDAVLSFYDKAQVEHQHYVANKRKEQENIQQNQGDLGDNQQNGFLPSDLGDLANFNLQQFGGPNNKNPSKVESETPSWPPGAGPITTPSPSIEMCIERCPTTSEYNPICGTNRQLYGNQQKFDCAVKCGTQVEIWRRGSCEGLFI